MFVIEERDNAVLVRVRVQPRASRDALRVESDGRVRVSLTAPPVADAANIALTEFLARYFRISKRSVSLVSGEKSREKAVSITGISAEEVRRRLTQAG